MRQMKEGQQAFFYHSNCKEPGIAGLMKVSFLPAALFYFSVWTHGWYLTLCPLLDCERSLCRPHSVWQKRCSLWRDQQNRQPQVVHGKVTMDICIYIIYPCISSVVFLLWQKYIQYVIHSFSWMLIKSTSHDSLVTQRTLLMCQVDVQYLRMLKRFLPLTELKKYHLQHRSSGGPLKNMALFTRARLSVQPLTTGTVWKKPF